MNTTHRILYLEQFPDEVERVRAVLAQEYIPCEVAWVDGLEAFESALKDGWRYDLLFAASQSRDRQTTQALEIAQRLAPNLPLICLAGDPDQGKAAGWLRAGARDQVPKSDLTRLGPAVRRALAEARHEAGEREALAGNDRLVSLLRAILEATSDGILVLDLAGRVSAYNQKYLSLCGIPEYVMAPMAMEKVVQFIADHFPAPEFFLNEVGLLGADPERESTNLVKTEDDRTLEQVGHPHRVAGQTLGRVYSLRDVTERETTASRIKRLTGNDQLLLEAAAAGEVVLWSLAKDTLLLSAFAGPLLGIQLSDGALDRDDLEALFHPEDLELFHRALEQPEDAHFEARLRRGGKDWVWTGWALRKTQGGRCHGVFFEVGGQRALQEQLAERRRLEWIGSLAASLAQDLRNPVQILRSHLDALAAAAPGADRREHLEACANAAGSLEAIMAQLAKAALAEPVAGLQLDLNVLVEKLGPWAESALGAGIRLRRELQAGLPVLPHRPGRLEPVLMNLVLNARDALGGSGEIIIRTGTAPLDGASPSAERPLFIEVEDNGPGIPPRALEHIFEPFFTTRAGAKGLGLTVVRSIAEGCGGSVQVDTEAMRGTRIRVLLPAGLAP